MSLLTLQRAERSQELFLAPQSWWLSPVAVPIVVAAASILPTFVIGDQKFRELWGTPKWITAETLFLFGCGALALAFGALVAITATPPQQMTSRWPCLSDRSIELLTRASAVLTAITVVGYAGFAFLILHTGLNPIELFSESTAYSSGTPVRDVVGTIPGITTMTQFGVAAVIVSSVVLAHGYSRTELMKLLTVVGFALPRALIFSERLAILELVLPVTVVLAGRLSASGGLQRRVANLVPVVGIVAVPGMFGFFEYFRSWAFYRHHTTSSFPEFVATRLAGYYTTALNNGQLVLDHLQWPRRLPYDTMDGFWTAPGVQQLDMYERLSGHPPPYTKTEWDSMYIGVLNHYGNPEFNSQSGYAGAIADFGHVGGVVYFLLAGVIAGLLYRGFRHGKPLGLFLYPLVFVGLLELPRYIYWSYGRTIYAWIGLLVVVALVSRCEAIGGRKH